MTLQTGVTVADGRYRIADCIGAGGFGKVYQAHDVLLGELVAIKELASDRAQDETMTKRFLLEAKTTMKLRHPRLVGTHNVFIERSNYYIVMEYMAGGSLDDILTQQDKVEVARALDITAQICEGLAYAHAVGVIHCDLKPANIMFDEQDNVKIGDFGIAHVSQQISARTWSTSDDFVGGTVLYMPPEQLDGIRDAARVDIYAVGAMFYQMLTGQHYLPFRMEVKSVSDYIYNAELIYRGEITVPSAHTPEVPAWLDTAVLTALARDPEERYQTAAELAQMLQQYKEPAPITEEEKVISKAEPAPSRATQESSVWGALITFEGQEHKLQVGNNSLGRATENTIVITDPHISRHHAEISCQTARANIIDLGSANGTFVNGRRLQVRLPYPLQTGDEVRLGKTARFIIHRYENVSPNTVGDTAVRSK